MPDPQRRAALIAEAGAILARARTEGRALTAEEAARDDAIEAELQQMATAPEPAPTTGGQTMTIAGSRYQQLMDERAALVRANQDLMDQAEAAGRNLTPEEATTVRQNQADARYKSEQIDLLEEQRTQERMINGTSGGSHIPTVRLGGPATSGAPSRAADMNWGYKFGVRMVQAQDGTPKFGGIPNAFDVALGDYLMAVKGAMTPNNEAADPRLFRAAVSGASSGMPSDGGFLVGTDFSRELMAMAMTEAVLAPRCRIIDLSGDSDGLEAPYIDETSRATGSRWGGIRIYRAAEADTVTASKPTFGMFELRLADIMGIAYATDRLLRDAAAIGQVFRDGFTSEFAFKLDDEIFRGTGVGECAGLVDTTANPALVSVTVETGQTLTDPIMTENIVKMNARLWARSRSNAVWLINQELEPYLQLMNVIVGAGGQLVYMPPGGLTAQPYATLFGRPVIVIEHASAPGTVGDIVLADLSQYILIRKGGLEFAESMHVRFLYNERTFRWVQSVNGKPKWRSALTPYKGTNTVSPFVTLAART